MSVALQNILNTVPLLSPEEVQVLLAELKEISVQVERKEKIRQTLLALKGKGKGVWQGDAQQLVNEMRTDRE
jgi:hypothetical protein